MKLRLPKDQAKKTIAYILSIVDDPVVIMSCHKEKQLVAFEGASAGAYVRVNISAEVEEGGVITVDGPQLSTIKFPVDVTFVADKGQLAFVSGTFKGSIPTLESGAHVTVQRPRMNLDSLPWVEVPKDLLTKAMGATVFDVALKSSISGVTMRIENRQLIMHALDGIRASLYVAPIDTDQTIRAVLSGNFFSALKKVPGEGPNIRMFFDSGSVLVRTDSALIGYPTLQTETADVYADVTDMLATAKNEGSFTIASKLLVNAVSTAASVIRGGLDYDINVDLTVKDGTLTIALVSDHGQTTDTLALTEASIPCSFRVSGKHMSEMLALLSGDVQVRYYGSTVLFLADEGRATVLLATRA